MAIVSFKRSPDVELIERFQQRVMPELEAMVISHANVIVNSDFRVENWYHYFQSATGHPLPVVLQMGLLNKIAANIEPEDMERIGGANITFSRQGASKWAYAIAYKDGRVKRMTLSDN